MSAYAGPRTTYRPYLPSMGGDALAGVRGSLREFRAAFRVATSAPARQDADTAVLLLLGRD
jgi:hypothetical protein